MTPRPKSSKTKFHIALEPHVSRMLKALAARHACPVGDVVDGLLRCVDGLPSHFGEAVPREALRDYLAACIADAGRSKGSSPAPGFIADDVEGHRAYLANTARLAREAGDETTATQFERRLAALDAEYGPEEG